MKTFGKIAAGVVGLLIVLILAIVLFIKNFDWDRARPWINEKVSAATGRSFVIDGHLTVQWRRPDGESGLRRLVPWPTLTARNVRIGNPEWAKRPQFASADVLSFEVELLPLLAHKIIVPHIGLTNPVIDIERTLDGKNNWTFKRKQNEPSKWDLELQELTFADGVIDVTDLPTKIDMRATIATIGKPIALGQLLAQQKAGAPKAPKAPDAIVAEEGKATPADTPPANAKAANTKAMGKKTADAGSADTKSIATADVGGNDDGKYGFKVGLDGTYRGAKLSGGGKIGGVISLLDKQTPFPIQADVRLGDNHLIAVGTVTDLAKLAAIDMQLTLAAPSMSDLYDLFGVNLPDTPRFRTSGHLTGNLDRAGSRFKYADFAGQVGRSDLSGTLEFTSALPRKRLVGTVHSKRLALADLGPAIGGAPVSKTAAPKGLAAAVKGKPVAVISTDKVLPNATFKTDRWKEMDVDVRFTGASILRSEALPISDMSTHILMQDGVLSFDPLKFGVAGGSMSGIIRLDGHSTPLDGRIDIAARHLQLKRLFPTFKPMDTSFGEINGDAKLSGRGNSTAALAATANGEVKLLINDGAISSTLLEEAGLNVANIVANKLFGDTTVKINCAAADFVAKDGVLNAKVFAFDTADALINVDGDVNLGSERMNLNVYPHTKGFRVFSLRSPLYVHGTFKKPDVGVMKTPLALRGAAALALGAVNPFASLLALLAPSNNQDSPCPGIIATARAGLKGAPGAR